MSRPIDEKIVELTLDNKQFEKNAEESIQTFKNMNKELSNGQVDMSGITNAVQKIADRFTLFGNITQEVLQRIAYTAVNTGERLVRSLSIDNINAGWNKYNELVQSTQTIMSATGKDIDYVNGYLEQLNWFTDETSYNFSDMASNIGKFTSAGVDLDTATKAMQGIATWAAISGQNARSASSAMYNFSQALGSGVMLTQDWRSIENANMATKEFKEMAIDAGLAIGTLRRGEDGLVHAVDASNGTLKEQVVTAENLRETLSDKWFTKDVMLKTLNAYGGFATELQSVSDTTGLIASEMLSYIDDYLDKTKDKEQVINDFAKDAGITGEEAKKILDKLSSSTYDMGRKAFKAAQEAKTFGEAIDSVKDAASTTFMNMFQNIFGNYEEAKELWTGLANGLYDIFIEPLNSLNDLLSAWKELGGRTAVLNGLKNALQGISNIISPIKEAFSNLMPKVTAEQLVNVSKSFESLTKKFAELDLSKWNETWGNFSNIITLVKDNMSKAGGTAKDFVGQFGELLTITNLVKVGGIAAVIKVLKDLISTGSGIKSFFGIFKEAKSAFKEGGLLGVFFGSGKRNDGPSISPIETFVKGISNIGKGLKLTGIALVAIAIKQLADAVTILSKLSFEEALFGMGVLKLISTELFNITQNLARSMKGGFSLILIATAVDMFALAIAGLSFIDGKRLATSLLALGGALTELIIAVNLLGKLDGPLTAIGGGVALILLASALDILSLSIAGLAMIDGDKLLNSIIAIGAALTELVMAVTIISKLDGPLQAIAGGVAFILLATSLDILTGALVALSFVNPEQLGMSLILVAGALGILIAACYAIQGAVVGVLALVGAGVALGLVAVSLMVFAGAVKVLETVDWSAFGASFGGALGLIALGLIAMTPAIPGALALTLAGAGLLALGAALVMLKDVDIASIAPGISNMLLALALGLTTMIIGLPGALALSVASLGLIALAAAVKEMQGLDMTTISQGLFEILMGLAVSLSAMIIGLPGALALLVAAPALLILAKALEAINAVGISDISDNLQSLLMSLAAGLTAMIIGLPGALALLVAAPALNILVKSLEEFNKYDAGTIGEQIGTLLIALAEGLTLMIVSLPGADALKQTAVALNLFTLSLESYDKYNVETIGNQIGSLLKSLAEGLTLMIASGSGASALEKAAPALSIIGDTIRNIQYLPIDTIANKLKTLLNVFSTELGNMTKATSGVDILTTLGTVLPQVAEGASQLTTSLNGFKGVGEIDWSAPFNGLTEAVINTVKESTENLIAGLTEMVTAITDFGSEVTGSATKSGSEIMDAFIKGITDSESSVKSKAGEIGSKASSSLKTYASYSNAASSGKYFTLGFINGMNSLMRDVINTATNIGSAAYNALKESIKQGSPSRLTYASGGFFDDGLINGMRDKLDLVKQAASDLGKYALFALNNSGILNPKISPIMDVDEITAMDYANNGIQMNLNSINKIQNGLTPIVETFNNMQKQITESNNKVINAITDLNDKLDAYNNRPVPQYDFYVNGDKLASSIAKPMDKQLAILAKRR